MLSFTHNHPRVGIIRYTYLCDGEPDTVIDPVFREKGKYLLKDTPRLKSIINFCAFRRKNIFLCGFTNWEYSFETWKAADRDFYAHSSPCPACNATGWDENYDPCPHCDGVGRVEDEPPLELSIRLRFWAFELPRSFVLEHIGTAGSGERFVRHNNKWYPLGEEQSRPFTREKWGL